MVVELKKFLKDSSFYYEKQIKDVPKSCCNECIHCDTLVLSFDEIKDDLCKKFQIEDDKKLCSVDALHFLKSREVICFVEMKKYSDKYELTKTDFIINHLKVFPKKVYDSYIILTTMLIYLQAPLEIYRAILTRTKIKAEACFLTNILYKDLMPIQLIAQQYLEISLSSKIGNNIALLDCDTFHNNYKNA